MNEVEIIGTIVNDFTKEENIKIGKEVLYRSEIQTMRDSGVYDVIPIIVDYNTAIQKGDRVIIHGNYMSYNLHLKDKNKLLLFIYVNDMKVTNREDANKVRLKGFLCKKGDVRKTPLGRTIADITLAINTLEKHSDYIPCVFWGKNAKIVNERKVGDNVEIIGRLQSRTYRKMMCERFEEMIAYEVSVCRLF